MPDNSVPRKYDNKKRDTNFPPVSEKNLQDALIDEKPESPTPRNHQSTALDAQVELSPSSKYKLQQALTDENARADPKDCVVESAWVNSHVKGLHEAYARGRKAELSTCGYPEMLGRCLAKEGIKRDLRYTLTQMLEKYGTLVLMYKGRDALDRHWVSGWKSMDAMPEQPFYLAVVMCVEGGEAGSKAQVFDASILADR